MSVERKVIPDLLLKREVGLCLMGLTSDENLINSLLEQVEAGEVRLEEIRERRIFYEEEEIPVGQLAEGEYSKSLKELEAKALWSAYQIRLPAATDPSSFGAFSCPPEFVCWGKGADWDYGDGFM